MLRERAVCSEVLGGVCAFFIACILSGIVGSRDMSPASSSSVTGIPGGRETICGAGEGEVALPCSSVEPWVVGFWSVLEGALLVNDAPSCGTGEGCVEPVRGVSPGSVPW